MKICLKLCEDCQKKRVASHRHRFCADCAALRQRAADVSSRRSRRRRERQSIALALAEQRAINESNRLRYMPQSRPQLMTDADQARIERECADRLVGTDIRSPLAYHVVAPAAWLWRSL